MPELVVIDLPAGPAYIEAIQRVWDAGDAFMPIDPRLPSGEGRRVVEALAPTQSLDANGNLTALTGGRPVEPGDALVIATSGTTGLPKGVVHTHASVEASARATTAALQIDPASDRWLACLPLAHIGGLSVVLRSMVTRTPVTVHDRFDAARVRDAALQGGVTRVSLVTKTLSQVDPSLFTTVLLGGAAPPPNRAVNCIATYGMTETGSGVVYEGWPLVGVELRVDGDEQIWVRAPMLLRVYRSAHSDIDPKDTNGWFPSGDLGFYHADGRIGVSGRAGDVIVTGGEKVWPTRVEQLIGAMVGVAEVAVVGRPNPEWGQVVTAVIVAEQGQVFPSLEQLRSAVREVLPTWYAPRAIELVEQLPKTDSGKIKRHLV